MKRVNKQPGYNTTSNHTHIIFVYGTLRKGCGNHYLLNASQFLGKAKTKSRYALYADGIPFLSRTKAVSTVIGEVYAVDEATLQMLDQLEGHPDWYRREKDDVILHDGTEVTAWIYFYDTPEGELIESGDFLENASTRRRQRSV